MDYRKIYSAFIASRKRIESDLQGYVEKHHIVPRSLGGSDDPENIVRLTPEDHFFAHLLLAKIHGGGMWTPLVLMAGANRKLWSRRRQRREYGWVRREMARSLSGEGAHQFDREEYHLVHSDGREWRGLQSQMTALGLSKSLANMLIKGRLETSMGWRLSHVVPVGKAGSAHHAYDADVYDFAHIDGAAFTGTSYELYTRMGLSADHVRRVVRGKQRATGGWHLKGKPPARVGRGASAGGCQVGEHGTTEIRLVHESGKVFRGTRRQACEAFGLPRGNLTSVVVGRRKKVKGWAIYDGPDQ